MKKTIVSITGIRPDFIRMAEIFKKLDENFNHILIHTGQHYDYSLTDVFFDQLKIRKPDFVLDCGKSSKTHYEQLSYLSTTIPLLFLENNINPDLIVFLGDSNTSAVSLPLKKEGYKICHIEAGMRSGDKRMLEEINRTVCDHCSDLLFVYHEDYKHNLFLENIKENVYVVGNTILEVFRKFKPLLSPPPPQKSKILVDIHRPENFKYPERVKSIIDFANKSGERYGVDVEMLYFKRLEDALNKDKISVGNIKIIPLLGYREYLEKLQSCKFLISDSGTGQEEPPLLGVKVVVPRDYTERPQSYRGGCSYRLDLNGNNYEDCWDWVEKSDNMDIRWLGEGDTSDKIIKRIVEYFEKN